MLPTLPANMFGHFVGTTAKCLAGILTALRNHDPVDP